MKKTTAVLSLLLCLILALSSPLAIAAGAEEALAYDQMLELLYLASEYDLLYGSAYSTDGVYYTLCTYYFMVVSPWKEMFDGNVWMIEVPAAEYEKTAAEYYELKQEGALDIILEDIRQYHGFNEETNCYRVYRPAFGDIGNVYLGFTKEGEEYTFWYAAAEYDEETWIPTALDHGKAYTLKWKNGHPCVLDSFEYTDNNIPAEFDSFPAFTSPVLGSELTLSDDYPWYYDSVSVFSSDSFDEPVAIFFEFSLPDYFESEESYVLADGENTMIYMMANTRSDEGETVQPKKPITLTFAIPEGFTHNLSVYYLDLDKDPEAVPVTVDALNGTFDITFDHFSAYAIVSGDVIKGDVDGDKTVTPADARLVLRASVALEDLGTGSVFEAANADTADSVLTPADARLILRAAVGLENPNNWKMA